MAYKVDGMSGLMRRLNAVLEAPEEFLDDWVPRTIAKAKRNLEPHKKTGDTSRSIQPGRKSLGEREVEAGHGAVFLEFGTRAHVIRPRRASVLRWPANASDRRLSGSARSGTTDFIYAREVHHPGTKADPFLVPAGEEALEENGLLDAIIKGWNGAA